MNDIQTIIKLLPKTEPTEEGRSVTKIFFLSSVFGLPYKNRFEIIDVNCEECGEHVDRWTVVFRERTIIDRIFRFLTNKKG